MNNSSAHTYQIHWHTPLWTRWSVQIPTQFLQHLRRKLQCCTSQSGSNLEGLLCRNLLFKDMNYILIKVNWIAFVEFLINWLLKKEFYSWARILSLIMSDSLSVSCKSLYDINWSYILFVISLKLSTHLSNEIFPTEKWLFSCAMLFLIFSV